MCACSNPNLRHEHVGRNRHRVTSVHTIKENSVFSRDALICSTAFSLPGTPLLSLCFLSFFPRRLVSAVSRDNPLFGVICRKAANWTGETR